MKGRIEIDGSTISLVWEGVSVDVPIWTMNNADIPPTDAEIFSRTFYTPNDELLQVDRIIRDGVESLRGDLDSE